MPASGPMLDIEVYCYVTQGDANVGSLHDSGQICGCGNITQYNRHLILPLTACLKSQTVTILNADLRSVPRMLPANRVQTTPVINIQRRRRGL